MAQMDEARVLTDTIASHLSDHNQLNSKANYVYDVKNYGATGDGATDDATAIQAAIDAANTAGGGVVYLPSGTYIVGTVLTLKTGVTLQGIGYKTSVQQAFGDAAWVAAGGVTGSVIKVTSTNNAFTMGAVRTQQVSLRDFAILGPGSGTSVGIFLDGTQATAYGHKFVDNVAVVNWSIGLDLNNLITNSLYGLFVRGCTTGIRFGETDVCVDDTFYGLEIQNCVTAIHFRAMWSIRFYGGLLQSVTTCIDYDQRVGLAFRQISFDGTHLEAFTDLWVLTGATLSTNSSFSNIYTPDSWTWTLADGDLIYHLTIYNCYFPGWTIDLSAYSATGTFDYFTAIGTQFGDVTGYKAGYTRNWNVVGCHREIPDVPFEMSSQQLGTLADDGTPTVGGGNFFQTGGTTAITDFDDGIEGQILYIHAGHTVTITNSSSIRLDNYTNFTMRSNDTLTLVGLSTGAWKELGRGENAVAGNKTWDPGSIGDGNENSTVVTATGCALGDFAIASFTLDVTDLTLDAQVTATNQVTCVLANNTGGAIDLGSGTLRVKVFRGQ